MSILADILAHKRTEIAQLDLVALQHAAADAPAPRDFLAALQPSAALPHAPRLIAELKRASPSRGLLAPHLDMLEIAEIYAQNGAAAYSVLTDEKFFLGRLDLLRQVANLQSSAANLPRLRKDFLIHPAQLYQSRAAGADAVLLIAAALPDDAEFADLHALALALGLTPLVEVHTLPELERVLRVPHVKLIGINNRDLATFTISLEVTAQLRPHIPAGITVVSESGIFTAAHTQQLAALNVHAILVGEALVTAEDVGAKVRALSGKSGN